MARTRNATCADCQSPTLECSDHYSGRGCLCYRGTFYKPVRQFYSSCWQRMHANGREANSPGKRLEWATCDETAKTAVYRHGIVFAGNPDYAVTPN